MAARRHLGPDGLPAPRFPRLKGRLPPVLMRCPACNQHVFQSAKVCPLCGCTIAEARRKRLAALKKAERAAAVLRRIFERASE